MGLDNNIKKALADRLWGWELVEFLNLPIEDIIEAYEDEISNNLEDVLDFAGIIDMEDNEKEQDQY